MRPAGFSFEFKTPFIFKILSKIFLSKLKSITFLQPFRLLYDFYFALFIQVFRVLMLEN